MNHTIVNNIDDCKPLTSILWDKSLDLAEKTLKTKVVSGFQHGNLSPDLYVLYIVQDIYYIEHVNKLISKKFNINNDFEDSLMKKIQNFGKTVSKIIL